MNPYFYNVSDWPNDGKQWQTNPIGNFCHAEIAVVIGTYNRAHLLLRSLFHYQECRRPTYKYEPRIHGNEAQMRIALVVMDDGSSDYTYSLCEKFANENLPIYYFYLGDKEPGTWRDSAAFINKGLSFAIHALGSHFIFPTHPEICVGETTISDSVEWLKENRNGFALARGYYLTPEQQKKYAFRDGKYMSILAGLHTKWFEFWEYHGIDNFINETPDFYTYGDQLHPYHHSQVEKTEIWESWIFAGASRETWLKFGGFSESEAWGAIDVTFHHRRYYGGFTTWTPEGQNNMVVHQSHDLGLPTDTPRDMEFCMETAKRLDATPCQPHLLNPNRWMK